MPPYKERKISLTTEYRTNFLGIFIGAARWLGSWLMSQWATELLKKNLKYNITSTEEPSSHENIYMYSLLKFYTFTSFFMSILYL